MGASCCVPVGSDLVLDPFGKIAYDPYSMKLHRKTTYKVGPTDEKIVNHNRNDNKNFQKKPPNPTPHHPNSTNRVAIEQTNNNPPPEATPILEVIKKEIKKVENITKDEGPRRRSPRIEPRRDISRGKEYFNAHNPINTEKNPIKKNPSPTTPQPEIIVNNYSTTSSNDTNNVNVIVNVNEGGNVINVPNLPFAKHIDFKLTAAASKKLEKNYSMPSFQGLKPRAQPFEKKFSFRNLNSTEDTFKTFYTNYTPKLYTLKDSKFEFLVQKRVLKIHKIERKCYEALKSLKSRFDFSKVEDPSYVESLLSPLSPNSSSSASETPQFTPDSKNEDNNSNFMNPPSIQKNGISVNSKFYEDDGSKGHERTFSRKGFPPLEINLKTVVETRRGSKDNAKNPRREEPLPRQKELDPNASSSLLLAFLVEKPFLKLVQETPENLEKELELRRLVEKPKSCALILSEKGQILKWNRYCERALEIRTMSNELKTFCGEYLEVIKKTSLFYKEAEKLKKKIALAKEDINNNENVDKRKRSVYSFKEFAYCVKETEDYFMAELTLLHSLTKTEFSRFLIPDYDEWKVEIEKTLAAVIEMANIYKSPKDVLLKKLVSGDVVHFSAVFEPFSTENGEIVILAKLTPLSPLSISLSSPRLLGESPQHRNTPGSSGSGTSAAESNNSELNINLKPTYSFSYNNRGSGNPRAGTPMASAN